MIETFTLPIGRMIVKLGGSLILKISYSYKKNNMYYTYTLLLLQDVDVIQLDQYQHNVIEQLVFAHVKIM